MRTAGTGHSFRPAAEIRDSRALARAHMRDAQLLILDEPAAALDARAEYEVFLRFRELTKARMASHLSPGLDGRMADRI